MIENYCVQVSMGTMLKILGGIYAAIGTNLAVAYIIHCLRDEAAKHYLKQVSYWSAVIVAAALWPYFFSGTIKKIFKG